MDNPYMSGGIGASVIVAIGIVYRAVNHKRMRSVCCGKRVDISLDIDTTTPPTVVKIRAPPEPAPATPTVKKSAESVDGRK